MQEKIIRKATEMFLKLGFKSVTMDDIAGEMCISKKTIYKYFTNKEVLIAEGTAIIHNKIQQIIGEIVAKNLNAIEENFEIKKMFREMFKSADHSPIYQLKRYYPEIHEKLIATEIEDCTTIFDQNIQKGIKQGLYRENIDIKTFVKFYYTLIFSLHETTQRENEILKLEIQALEYHTRAIATAEGIIELEKQLLNYNI